MKKLSILCLLFSLGIMLFSCSKEGLSNEVTNDSKDKSETYFNREGETESQEQILEILNLASQKLRELSNEAYKEIAAPLEEELSTEGQLSSIENVPLEDLFYLYEGIISYQILK